MEDLYFGAATIALCVAGYYFAFRQYNRNKMTAALLLLMLCGFLLRIYTASDLYLHAWDERYHALVARHLMDHPLIPTLYNDPDLPFDPRSWTRSHIWLHKQPLPLWAMALSMSAFGTNEIALRLPSVLLTTLGIALTYFIGRDLFNRKVGMLAAFLYSIHGLIIEISAGRIATDHIDAFFLFFIELAVYLAIRFFRSKKPFFNILCGISIGLAILSKWLPALIVLPVWLLLALDSKSFSLRQILLHFMTLCFTVALIALPWQLYIFSAFPVEAQWESSFNMKHITRALENHGQPFYYHFDKARILYGELIYLPLVWFFYKSFRHPGNYRRMILSLWILIPFLFFSVARTKMQAYTLFTAPAIFIVTALFFVYLGRFRKRFRYRVLIVLVQLFLIALPVRFAVERIQPFTNRERNPEWTRELRELDSRLSNRERTVIMNSSHPIETMFYTSCTTYSGIRDHKTLVSMRDRGYTILIRQDLDDQITDRTGTARDILLPGFRVAYLEWQDE